jgi:hypothetical protein
MRAMTTKEIREELDSIMAEVMNFQTIPGTTFTAWYERQVCLENISYALAKLEDFVEQTMNAHPVASASEEECEADQKAYQTLLDQVGY